MNFLSPLFAGIITSSLHVASGPDHLAAVTPLVFETKQKSWKIGLLWGLGHILGMTLIGLLFLVFKDYIPVENISNYSEQIVGFTLIFIGLWSFYRVFYKKKQIVLPHVHKNKNENYTHIHKIQNKTESHKHKNLKDTSTISSFSVGFLHGLAGIAHFLLLFPAATFQSKYESGLYLIGAAVGTLGTMISYTAILNLIKQHSTNKKYLAFARVTGAIIAILIGSYWIHST